jgi:hypothetical protein
VPVSLALSVALIVKLYAPAVFGLPEIKPPVVNVSPDGSVPALRLKL